jgi:hypothetical protein
MRNWLIGCGVLVAIVVVVAVWGWNYLSKEYQEVSGRLDEVKADYHQLNKDYAFEKPSGADLTSDQVARFVDCRRTLQASLTYNKWFHNLEKEAPSFLDALTQLGDMLSSLGRAHVTALKKVHMSPDEYEWILHQVLVALRYAESAKEYPKLKDLRSAFDALPDKEGDKLPLSEERTRIIAAAGETLHMLLPQIEPFQIVLPDSMIQAMLDHHPGLGETLEVFLHFDPSFKTLNRELKTETTLKSLGKLTNEADPGRTGEESSPMLEEDK